MSSNVYRIHFPLVDAEGIPIEFDQTTIDTARQSLIDLQAYILQWNALIWSKMDQVKQDNFPDITNVSPANPVMICSVVQSDSFIEL